MRFISVYSNLVLVMEPAQFGEVKGRRIQFSNGEYVTNDPEEIEFIKKNSGYGIYIFGEEAPVQESKRKKGE